MSKLKKTIIGIDLSGPANTDGTAMACFEERSGELIHLTSEGGVTDHRIVDVMASIETDDVVVGLDAPLSYNPGGGDRPADADLRRRLQDKGLPSGSVMTPTMTRMAYLTLRGIAVARLIQTTRRDAQIVEVHPGGTMVLRGAEVETVRSMKSKTKAREKLIEWLAAQGLGNMPSGIPSDHQVAAYAAALTAWKWNVGESKWLHHADPPFHPFDFAC